MDNSTSLPNAWYIWCHFLTVPLGTASSPATDLQPRPELKSAAARPLTPISCLTLRSVRIRMPPISRCPRNGRQFMDYRSPMQYRRDLGLLAA